MADFVIINDVGPRDGLQSQQKLLAPDERVDLINALVEAGVKHIEVGSFVSPKAVPAMAHTDQVLAGLPASASHQFSVLIPNLKGYELATAAGAHNLSMVIYGSDEMAQKNAGMSRAQAEQAAGAILKLARQDGVRVAITIAVSFECPFFGPIDPGLVADIASRFLELGADDIVLADTIGAANPVQVRSLTCRLAKTNDPSSIACHFHDTRAMGLANVYAASESGIRKFDTSIGGLGGCPFAPGASGNVATEDVVMMLEQMGFETGISLEPLLAAATLARQLTGTAPGGRATPWLERQIRPAS